jgi:probable F420-dependent oxidoreductase
MNGGSARWRDLLAMARTAEQVGFDSVWVTDHLIHRTESSDVQSAIGGDRRALEGPWECWSLLAALAASTERVEIGSLVVCSSFRNPALLAKMADTVDEISAGRLVLGLGSGWNEPEYRAFGYPFDHRVSRFEEALQIITCLLRTGHVDFDGVYHQARDCELRPRGPRSGGPPVVVGCNGARMLRFAARHADWWNTWFSQTNNELGRLHSMLAQVDSACAAVGRDPATLVRSAAATLVRSAAVKVEIGPHAPSQMSAPALTGTPQELAEQMRAHV